MSKRILQDIKKNHLHFLLNSIFIKDSATMSELINATKLSQPSVRNMVRFLQQNNIVKEIGNDNSTGGRCPTRFALVEQRFKILCLYIQSPKITYQIYLYKELLTQGDIDFNYEKELKDIVHDLITKSNCHCLVITVEGIVQDSEYLTDHQNNFVTHDWIKALQSVVNIPILLENDVKTMQLGAYYHHRQTDSVYLHLNNKGVGSSFMHDGKLVHGKYGIAGEIGLLPYQDTTLNQAIRICKTTTEFQNILAFLLIIILTTYDPRNIDLSIDLDWKQDWKVINKTIYTYLHPQFEHNINIQQNYLNNLFYGSNYLGIEKIIEVLVEEDNEKI